MTAHSFSEGYMQFVTYFSKRYDAGHRDWGTCFFRRAYTFSGIKDAEGQDAFELFLGRNGDMMLGVQVTEEAKLDLTSKEQGYLRDVLYGRGVTLYRPARRADTDQTCQHPTLSRRQWGESVAALAAGWTLLAAGMNFAQALYRVDRLNKGGVAPNQADRLRAEIRENIGDASKLSLAAMGIRRANDLIFRRLDERTLETFSASFSQALQAAARGSREERENYRSKC